MLISCKSLLQRPLKVMNMPDGFFWTYQSKHPHAKQEVDAQRIHEEVNIEMILLRFIIFLCCLLEGKGDKKA